jgi:hypothetical protein
LRDIDLKSIQFIYEFAPHLAEKPRQSRLPRPVDPRDLEIYRLHTVEKKTIRQIADIYQLSEIRVWNICTFIRTQEEPPLILLRRFLGIFIPLGALQYPGVSKAITVDQAETMTDISLFGAVQ